MCMDCVLQLARSVTFKQQLETADVTLRQYLAQGYLNCTTITLESTAETINLQQTLFVNSNEFLVNSDDCLNDGKAEQTNLDSRTNEAPLTQDDEICNGAVDDRASNSSSPCNDKDDDEANNGGYKQESDEMEYLTNDLRNEDDSVESDVRTLVKSWSCFVCQKPFPGEFLFRRKHPLPFSFAHR